VKQSVDAAEVDEGAVLGDVLHRALHDLALVETLEGRLLARGVLFLEDGLAREHDVAAALVDLDDLHAELFAAQGVEVPHGTHVHERSGEERADADVDGETALDRSMTRPVTTRPSL
jgi:hypothetical protein